MNVKVSPEQTAQRITRNDWAPEKPVGEDVNFRVLLGRLSYKRWPIIVPAFVLSFIAAIIALQMPDRYTSTGQLMLNAGETNIVDIDKVITNLPGDTRLIEGEISVMRSNEVLHEVLTELNLYEDPEFNTLLREQSFSLVKTIRGAIRAIIGGGDSGGPTKVAPEGFTPAQIETIKNLRAVLETKQVGLSLVISISVTSESPVKAARIANEIANQYIANQVAVKLDVTREAAAWLRERSEGLRQRLEDSEAAVESFKATMLSSDQTAGVTEQQLGEINSQLVLARADRAASEARYTEVTRRLNKDGPATAELLVNSDIVTSLRAEIVTLTAQRSNLASQFGASNPQLQKLDAQLEKLERRLDLEIQRAADAMAGEAATALARERSLRQSLSELERQLSVQSTRALRLRQLDRVAEADRNIYQTFLLRLNELTEQVGIQQADARVISSGVPADQPSSPNRKLIVVAAGFFGVLLGGAFVFISEAFTSSFRTDVEVRERIGLRTLARIPNAGARMTPLQLIAHTRNNPLSALSRAARNMIVTLIGGSTGMYRTILVTSANGGEGRTTMCLLLADFLARIGMTAVIVDCDFRNPTLSRTFAAKKGADLVDAIAGRTSAEQIVRRDATTGIEFVPIVDHKGYGPEILYTEAYEDLLAELRKSYQFVILDAAPMSMTPDACALSRHADFVIFAIHWHKTTEQVVDSAVTRLFQFGAHRVGAVLTLVNTRKERRYRKRVHNLDET